MDAESELRKDAPPQETRLGNEAKSMSAISRFCTKCSSCYQSSQYADIIGVSLPIPLDDQSGPIHRTRVPVLVLSGLASEWLYGIQSAQILLKRSSSLKTQTGKMRSCRRVQNNLGAGKDLVESHILRTVSSNRDSGRMSAVEVNESWNYPEALHAVRRTMNALHLYQRSAGNPQEVTRANGRTRKGGKESLLRNCLLHNTRTNRAKFHENGRQQALLNMGTGIEFYRMTGPRPVRNAPLHGRPHKDHPSVALCWYLRSGLRPVSDAGTIPYFSGQHALGIRSVCDESKHPMSIEAWQPIYIVSV